MGSNEKVTDAELLKNLSAKKMIESSKDCWAVGVDVLHVNADRLRIKLRDFREAVIKRHEWIAPLGIFLSVLATLVSADFKNFIFSPSVWKSLYILGALITFIWLIISLLKVHTNRETSDVESIMNSLMTSEDQSDE